MWLLQKHHSLCTRSVERGGCVLAVSWIGCIQGGPAAHLWEGAGRMQLERGWESTSPS